MGHVMLIAIVIAAGFIGLALAAWMMSDFQ